MSDKKNFQSQIVKRRHSKHFAFRCLLEFRNLADFKDSEIPIIDWGALSLTNIFLTCIPVYILYIYVFILYTIPGQTLQQLLGKAWPSYWGDDWDTESLAGEHRDSMSYIIYNIYLYMIILIYIETQTDIDNQPTKPGRWCGSPNFLPIIISQKYLLYMMYDIWFNDLWYIYNIIIFYDVSFWPSNSPNGWKQNSSSLHFTYR